ncbi:inositol monophosphatase family protein [Corynebacterium felinum]|uniref:inositol-phosphate phosphatase n=1 Tax=Corynebacterium felinum TaxID=131318 RepID=A0ABU2BBR8_9CORY|nr:inositol monophosphatase family protein [Corynebacterium felinum]MDF5819538.1 inositol monophosphatase family protein [Corynebacterium felinum]MDR7356079.1 myo-inositol-1(or 4)-monophosphatase [Corynebacterium felinum]WJY95413.1 Inositol-1-monophosphatase ImpA [Corynebacterium felinum]
MIDIPGLYRIAVEVAQQAEQAFINGIGARPALLKDAGDFATDVDLEIEQLVRTKLVELTGIPVYGEEYGALDCTLDQPMWVVDPVDGTANFAAGNPMCSILMSLVVNRRPVVGITSLPLTRQRFGAYDSSPLFINDQPQPALVERPEIACHVGFSSVSSRSNSQFPGLMRHGFLAELTKTYLRPRITGSVGVDLGFTAAGIFAGAVSFSPHLWDNAAGVVLAQAAGALVTDLHGDPWQIDAPGVVLGTPRAHATILETMHTVRTQFTHEDLSQEFDT